jgi:hypothetical protein
MPEPRDASRRLAYRAARRLPRAIRQTHLRVWLSELDSIPTADARLEYARGLRQGAIGIASALDPEWAFVTDVMRAAGIAALGAITLGYAGVGGPALIELGQALPFALAITLFAQLVVKCVLSLPDLRSVWWRFGLMVVLTLGCLVVLLAWMGAGIAFHSAFTVPYLLCPVAGLILACRFHRAPEAMV